MFPYDPQLAAATTQTPQTIPDVLGAMQTIDSLCIDGDGLKWFNWLYLQVTQAVESRVSAGGFNDALWLATLDVQFAALYFKALNAFLTGASCPGCWRALFSRRNQVLISRLQFAFAGMNAHINHDLALAVDATCRATNTAPLHGTPQYADYTAINSTLDTLTDEAKQTLHVRLLGDALPPVSHLEDLLAAINIAAFRENAWDNAARLWQAPRIVAAILEDGIDELTAFAATALLVPVP